MGIVRWEKILHQEEGCAQKITNNGVNKLEKKEDAEMGEDNNKKKDWKKRYQEKYANKEIKERTKMEKKENAGRGETIMDWKERYFIREKGVQKKEENKGQTRGEKEDEGSREENDRREILCQEERCAKK